MPSQRAAVPPSVSHMDLRQSHVTLGVIALFPDKEPCEGMSKS